MIIPDAFEKSIGNFQENQTQLPMVKPMAKQKMAKGIIGY